MPTPNNGNYELFKDNEFICVKNVTSSTIIHKSLNATGAFKNAFNALSQTGGNLTIAPATYYITGSPGRDYDGIQAKNLPMLTLYSKMVLS
jgi:hypothetical protein